MRILWVTCMGQLTRLPNGRMTSDQASARLRMCVPGQELLERGHEVTYAKVGDGLSPTTILKSAKPETVIFCKSLISDNERLLVAAKEQGIRTIVDLCDNHFVNKANAPHVRFMVQQADMITCSTQGMLDATLQETNKPCYIIPDPYEYAKAPPRFQPGGESLRLLWFGHHNNIGGLYESFQPLMQVASKIPLSIKVLSSFSQDIADDMKSVSPQSGGRIQAELIEWSLERQASELAECDLVIVPTPRAYAPTPDITVEGIAEYMKVKSPNRIIEPLWSGRMVVAHPKPSYEPFREWAWLGENIAEGVVWCLTHAAEIPARIQAAQEYIVKHHSPSVIADQWERVIKMEARLEA